jgi:hypothetical protein
MNFLAGRLALALTSLVLAIALVAIGFLVWGSSEVPTSIPKSAHFQLASSYVPPIPYSGELGVPIRSGDPGFNGWSGIVIGRVTLCAAQRREVVKVAVFRGSKFVAGQVANARGEFDVRFQWPLIPSNGGGPATYTIVSTTGETVTATLFVDDETYVVLPRTC